MGALVCVSGTASNINYFPETVDPVDAFQGRWSGFLKTTDSISFRVDNRSIKFSGRPDIGESDTVTVVGDGSGGAIAGYLVVNDSTNIEYFYCGPIVDKNFGGGVFGIGSFVGFSISFILGLVSVGFCI